jgi:hypothetical protein
MAACTDAAAAPNDAGGTRGIPTKRDLFLTRRSA